MCSMLDGGNAGWEAAGYELFSGVNVPSKAFGELVEHENGTPSISADELNALMQSGTDMVVLDSRPLDEFQRVSIPTGVNVPGAELVLRVHDMAPKPDTLVVVNCAGRTRSIIGAQSLINAGVPNKVVALRNGTMGWSLAGLAPDSGQSRRAPAVSHGALAWAKSAAESVASKLDIRSIDEAALAQLRADASRTTYLFDVRDPDEYAAGHVAGAISAPGGQLVQATDQYAGTLQRAHRAGRRQGGARRDDGLVAHADGLARGLRAGRGGRGAGLSAGAGARRGGARRRDRCGGAQRHARAQRSDRDRSLAQPRLS